jgi:hypothetical protein
MADIRRRLATLERVVKCPRHPEHRLLCWACDLRDLSPEETAELEALLEQAGALEDAFVDSLAFAGDCWRCGRRSACLACDHREPPGLQRMREGDRQRLEALLTQMCPPWLIE